MEWSSDSSQDEESYTIEEEEEAAQTESPSLAVHRYHPRNLMDMTEEEDETGGDTAATISPSGSAMNSNHSSSSRPDARALLRTVAAVHLPSSSLRYDADYGEARTSISSPGRRLTLRERLRARARLQKRIQKAREEGSQDLEDDDGFVLEETEENIESEYYSSFPECPVDARDRYYNTASSRHHRVRSRNNNNNNPGRVQIVPTGSTNYNKRATETTKSSKPRLNRIMLHVYDLIEKDTLMMLPPFGCVVEIGKCFAEMNSALHAVGTGAYHVGVEINGVEYAYGATSVPNQTGVFTCFPRLSPGYQYRTTIDLGERPLVRRSWVSVPSDQDGQQTVYRQIQEYVEGRTVMKEMAADYMGIDYDILRKNCCTFARDACLRLGVPDEEIPTWFRNLAESGALTQDAVRATVQPLTSVLSLACEDTTKFLEESEGLVVDSVAGSAMADDQGIETIFQTTNHSRVVVVEDVHSARDLRRNSTWTY